MRREIFISSGAFIRRIALVIDGRLNELSVESDACLSLVEGIYLGKIVKVMPSINAAFVDCGLGSAEAGCGLGGRGGSFPFRD